MRKTALLVALASSALAAQAQQPIGTLQDVSGAVSVSGKSVVSRAANGTPIADGASILVSSSGKATLILQTGCSVNLGANQHLTVSAKMPCEQMTASVKHLFPAYKVAQAPLGSLPPPPPLNPPIGLFPGFTSGLVAPIVVGGVISLGIIDQVNNDNPVSGQ